MKRSELFFSAIRVPMDYAMIVLAAVAAFTIRDLPMTRDLLDLARIEKVFSFHEYFTIALVDFFEAWTRRISGGPSSKSLSVAKSIICTDFIIGFLKAG